MMAAHGLVLTGKKLCGVQAGQKQIQTIKLNIKTFLKRFVAPTQMEVFVANADGSDAKTNNQFGQANWAPNFTPDGKHIIFCSNHEYKHGFPFNMYLINLDGSGLKKLQSR